MTASPWGMPLDLRAVDVAVERAEYTWGRDHEVVALLRTLRDQVRALRAALQRLASSAEQVAWTNRGHADVSEESYWSFVPSDEVKRAAAVLAQGRDA